MKNTLLQINSRKKKTSEEDDNVEKYKINRESRLSSFTKPVETA